MYYSKRKLSLRHTCAAFNRTAQYSPPIVPLGRWKWCLSLPGLFPQPRAAIHLDGQQRATSYQAKKLQEEEVIDEQDAVGKQGPPHVTQRFGLVNACGEETLVSEKQQRNNKWLLRVFPVMKQKQNKKQKTLRKEKKSKNLENHTLYHWTYLTRLHFERIFRVRLQVASRLNTETCLRHCEFTLKQTVVAYRSRAGLCERTGCSCSL